MLDIKKATKICTHIIVMVAFCSLAACGPSKEERAQEMAANYLKGVLFHFDSYEPLQTRVDSSFVSLSTDMEAIGLVIKMFELFKLAQEYSDEIEDAESSMEIWSSGGSAFSQGEYRRAKEKRDENECLLERARGRINNQFIKIKERQSGLKAGGFNGWKVYHRFKSLNGLGTVYLPGEYIFLCDADFKDMSAYPKDTYEMIRKVMDALYLSKNLEEFVDRVQEEVY